MRWFACFAALIGLAVLGPFWSAAPAGQAQTAPAAAQSPAAGAPPPTPAWALTGNLQQVMRGIFFPNANMIFNVQTHDPGVKKPVPGNGPGGSNFNWVTWGAGLYSGWDDVSYAAVTLAEVSPLLLAPGRTCENGTPVPVARADWVKFTMDMAEAARKSYKAAQAKNQEAVSDSTNDLNDACQQCHRAYRDRRPAGVDRAAPTANTLRCAVP